VFFHENLFALAVGIAFDVAQVHKGRDALGEFLGVGVGRAVVTAGYETGYGEEGGRKNNFLEKLLCSFFGLFISLSQIYILVVKKKQVVS
jgi:hypothetical protein